MKLDAKEIKMVWNLSDKRLTTSIMLALKAGEGLIEGFLKQGIEIERDFHHAIHTAADTESQHIILQGLHGDFPEAFFLAEEPATEEIWSYRLLNSETFPDHLSDLVFVVDPLDGTSSHHRGHYEFSVSIGWRKDGVISGGAIYAPAIKRGGFLVFALCGKGAYVKELDRLVRRVELLTKQDIKNAYVLYGIDVPLFPLLHSFTSELAEKSRTLNMVGSCALGLALIASGKTDVFFQAPQKPWDWVAGYSAVVEAGGKFQFYRLENDNFELLPEPTLEAYDASKRCIGFIAGVPNLVDEVSEELIKVYQKEA